MDIHRILSVDDNSIDLLMHRRRIHRYNERIEVVDADHGQHALDILAAGDFWPDLILLDINMPILDGFGFLDGAVASYADRIPPVVLTLTSAFQDKDLDRAADYPAVVGSLLKPLTPGWIEEVTAMLDGGEDS